MHPRVKTTLAAIAVTALAVVGMDAYTYASTGKSLILGHTNKANKTTHIKSTGKGPALSLHAKGERPALAVDSKAKVIRLNADLVDGKGATSLRNNVRVYTAKSSDSDHNILSFELPNFPKGRYQATYSLVMFTTASASPDNPIFGECSLRPNQGNVTAGHTTAEVTHYDRLGLSASDVITKGRAAWQLSCFSTYFWSIDPRQPVRVTLTRIDKKIGGKLDLLREGSVDRLPGG